MSAAAAHAAEHEGADRGPDEPDGYHWGLGAGASIKESPYAGVGTKTSALPLVSFENKTIRFYGTQLDAKLPSWGAFDFSLRAQFSIGEGYKGSDSAQLAGMEARKGAVFVGAASTWRNEVADVSVSWLKDVSGHSKGSELKLGAEHRFRFDGRFELVPHLALTRHDAKFDDYYYGVRADEATPTRPEYEAKSATEVQAGVRFGYAFTLQQSLLLDVSDTRLGNAVTDSPIVERKSIPRVIIGYHYAF